MFSGLTNQVTSWMGSKPQDEEVPTPPPTQTEKPEEPVVQHVEETPVEANEENGQKTR